jgi:hypothetical protein
MARRPPEPEVRIDLVRVVELLLEHLSPALCQAAFRQVRTSERQRKWTLHALVRFWTAVILRAPQALTQALGEALDGREPLFPRVQATPEAFFQRCRDLRPAFFAEVFRRFTGRIVAAVPPRYAAPVAPVRARFAGGIVLIDGSRLAAIAHRLKLLWDERAVILPGCVLALYDLGRGLCRALYFSADAAASEMTRAKAALGAVMADTLVVGDRLYGTADFFAALQAQQCWGVVRRNRRLRLHRLQRRRRCRYQDGLLEEWVVRAGTGVSAPAQTLRHIRWRQGRTRHEVLTNVLSAGRLSAEEALALYAYRWSIERMYFDLKEVLNLNRIYAGNPNAVAMQVYAAGIVYNALRAAQSEVSVAGDIEPEELSPAKLYPRMAAAFFMYVQGLEWERRLRRRAGRAHLRLIGGADRWRSAPLSVVRRERRDKHRRKRRFCPARRRWKSLAKVRGGRKLVQLS